MKPRQKILVFQQQDSGVAKTSGIRRYGDDRFDLQVITIQGPLPDIIEDGTAYLPPRIEADLVLDYLRHPDLSCDLAALCANSGVPVIASGKKHKAKGLVTPKTCCGLARLEQLGEYAERFGAPEFSAAVEDGRVISIEVVRGAPCGATWTAAEKVTGLPVAEAVVRIGLETQYCCIADPAGWDPLWGKSPVHFAGDVHSAALKRAVGVDSGS